MKKRLALLLAGFVVCYYAIHVAYDLPNLIHGTPHFDWLPTNRLNVAVRLAEMGTAFLFVLLPYLALHTYYPHNKTGWAVLLALAGVVCVFFIQYALRWALIRPVRLRNFFNDNLFFTGVYLLYGVVFYFVRYAWHKEVEQKDLLLQNRQAELSFLRSQINPHFLFNSLNNIYALVYDLSPNALPAIAGLSELLRYMLYDANDFVPLEKELAYIEKYIGLQMLRFGHPVQAYLQVNGAISGIKIAPLLLVPFIENAFKHGDLAQGGRGIEAVLNAVDTKLYFYCFNTKGAGQKDIGGGIGLTNIRRRLHLLYPGRHTLQINDTPHSFTVNLELQYGQ